MDLGNSILNKWILGSVIKESQLKCSGKTECPIQMAQLYYKGLNAFQQTLYTLRKASDKVCGYQKWSFCVFINVVWDND
jgi:hypothetical protein